MARSFSDQQKQQSAEIKKPRPGRSGDSQQLIWGVHPVLEALEASSGIVREVYVDRAKSGKIPKIIELSRKHGITVSHDMDLFNSNALQKYGFKVQDRHQGVIARISFQYCSLAELFAGQGAGESVPFILALDSIQDPQNLGAIFRSAVAAGFNRIILPKDRAAQVTGAVAKASAGAVFHVDVCRVTNLVKAIDSLKEKGIWVFGTTIDAPLTIHEADFTVPACLVIGNEEKGLRPLVKEHCDFLVSIPMSGSLNSLNASVAAGIVLFEIARQRSI